MPYYVESISYSWEPQKFTLESDAREYAQEMANTHNETAYIYQKSAPEGWYIGRVDPTTPDLDTIR